VTWLGSADFTAIRGAAQRRQNREAHAHVTVSYMIYPFFNFNLATLPKNRLKIMVIETVLERKANLRDSINNN
jgi:hypothetical protein